MSKAAPKPFHVTLERPNYGLSGILEEDAARKGLLPVKVRYSEPSDRCSALTPTPELHVFENGIKKSSQSLSKSTYILGRDLSVPGARLYHAALQFRKPNDRDAGLYIAALDGPVNLSGQSLEPDKFVEVMDQDILMIGEVELVVTMLQN